ncbi:hypothetical protein MHU86_8202 [Fragilaria crotonensis]|nr:hypothetical protein MHU86_8202 [Fragilaria crotonensis]
MHEARSLPDDLPPLDPMIPEWDLLTEIRNTLRGLPFVQLVYVKGHQDNDKSYRQLNQMAQMNVDADHMAGRYQTALGRAHPFALMSPTTGTHLIYPEEVRDHVMKCGAASRQRWRDKFLQEINMFHDKAETYPLLRHLWNEAIKSGCALMNPIFWYPQCCIIPMFAKLLYNKTEWMATAYKRTFRHNMESDTRGVLSTAASANGHGGSSERRDMAETVYRENMEAVGEAMEITK